MYIKFLVLSLTFAYVAADLVNIFECPNTTTHAKDISMQVSECTTNDVRCPLYQGKSHSVVFKFVPLKNYTGKVDFKVYGVFEKFTVPYRGRSDAYDSAIYTESGEQLKDVGMFIANKEIQHSSEFSVSVNYPKIELFVRFIVQERRTKEIMMCTQIPVGIKAAPGSEDDNNA